MPCGLRTKAFAGAVATVLLFCLTVPPAGSAGAQDAEEVIALLNAVVAVRAEVPEDARTAASLGTEREGSGVVIDADGLVVTIGYLILEADRVEVHTGDEAIPATVVAYDHESGFGLVRAAHPLAVAPMALGDSAGVSAGDPVLVVSRGDGHALTPARVVSRRLFAGYWEYLLDDAIFTAPPHPRFGGAALVDTGGRLVGIGSLLVGDAAAEGEPLPGNMFVPMEALTAVLADLLAEGRRPGPAVPWLGLFAREARGRVVVTRVADDGPAAAAGIAPGDLIIGVDGARVGGLPDFYRRVRAQGGAGTDIPLDVVRRASPELAIERIAVHSADRTTWLKGEGR